MVVGRDLANLLCMNNLSNHLATYYNSYMQHMLITVNTPFLDVNLAC